MLNPTNQPNPSFTCSSPINTGPAHYVLDAAFYRLNRWVAKGVAPPVAPRLETTGMSPVVFATDANGNVLGGIRTPAVDAPVATLSGARTGGSSFCFLFGTTVPFTPSQLAALYPNHGTFVAAWTRATKSAREAGFLVDADAKELIVRRGALRHREVGAARLEARQTSRRDGCQTRTMSDTTVNPARQPWWRGGDAGHRLAGKRAFVTGAGTAPGGDVLGIGEAIAVLFAAQGAKVAIADISAERAEATLRLVEDVGGEGVVTVGDLTVLDDNARCVQEAVDAFGGLDTVVNSAALSGGGGSPVDVDLDAWERGDGGQPPRHPAHRAPHVPAPRRRRRRIDRQHLVDRRPRGHGSGAYAASKAAMLGLTRDWAYVHGRDGIRVNCILPGHVYTPMGNQGGPECASAAAAPGCSRPRAWRGTSPGPRCSWHPRRAAGSPASSSQSTRAPRPRRRSRSSCSTTATPPEQVRSGELGHDVADEGLDLRAAGARPAAHEVAVALVAPLGGVLAGGVEVVERQGAGPHDRARIATRPRRQLVDARGGVPQRVRRAEGVPHVGVAGDERQRAPRPACRRPRSAGAATAPGGGAPGRRAATRPCPS